MVCISATHLKNRRRSESQVGLNMDLSVPQNSIPDHGWPSFSAWRWQFWGILHSRADANVHQSVSSSVPVIICPTVKTAMSRSSSGGHEQVPIFPIYLFPKPEPYCGSPPQGGAKTQKNNGDTLWIPRVNQHSYRKSPFWIGKSTINGHFFIASCMFTRG